MLSGIFNDCRIFFLCQRLLLIVSGYIIQVYAILKSPENEMTEIDAFLGIIQGLTEFFLYLLVVI